MRNFVCLLLVCLSAVEGSVKVSRSSRDGRHPSTMELEVELPDTKRSVKIPLARSSHFENVPMTVHLNGAKRTFSTSQLHHEGHSHYSGIATKSVISVRELNGRKEFEGHFEHQGRTYFVEPNAAGGHQIRKVPIDPRLKDIQKQKKSVVKAISRKRRQLGGKPTEFVVEIGLCIAYSSYEKITKLFQASGADPMVELYRYYGHIMLGVDCAYRNITDLSISIKVVSVTLDSTANDFNCMPGMDVPNRLVGIDILKFLQNKMKAMGSSAPGHLMSFTAEDITDGTSSGVCGMAFMSSVCSDYGVSINEDQGPQSWGVAAHELGHNLGMGHDSGACDPNEHKLMSPVGGIYTLENVINSYKFSTCSVNNMKDFINKLNAGGCLKKSVGTQVNSLVSSVSEGSRLTLDKVCGLAYPNSPGKFFLASSMANQPAQICAKIYCQTASGSGTTTSGLRAPAGSSCGNQKSCDWRGACTFDRMAPTLDEKCFFGNFWTNCDAWKNALTPAGSANANYYCPQVKASCCRSLKAICP